MQVAEQWDSCIENTVRKLAYGALSGGLAAIILFRASSPRTQFPPPPPSVQHLAPQRHPHREAIGRYRLLARARFAGSPAARSAVAGLGAGIGVGMGYTDCKYDFEVISKAVGDAKSS